MRFIELFAGIGGFRYGLESVDRKKNVESKENKKRNKKQRLVSKKRKGNCSKTRQFNEQSNGEPNSRKFTCVWANEIDKYACQIYRKNFGKKELIEGNIRSIPTESIPNHNLLTAGFPCQSFSIAGKRKGMSGEDTRGTLFYEIYRIAKERQPQLLLLENVPGLFSSRNGEDFYTILKSLDEIGYDVEWDCINTSIFLPQNRLRVFIVGHLRGKGGQKVFPIGSTMRKGDEGIKRQKSGCIKPGEGRNQNHGTFIIKRVQWDTSGKGYKSQQDRAYLTDGIMCCLPNANPDNKLNIISPTLYGFKHGTHKHFNEILPKQLGLIRRLTPTECERLQGFPDGWTKGISDTQRYKCLGNAVTVNVVEEIGRKLIND